MTLSFKTKTLSPPYKPNQLRSMFHVSSGTYAGSYSDVTVSLITGDRWTSTMDRCPFYIYQRILPITRSAFMIGCCGVNRAEISAYILQDAFFTLFKSCLDL